MIQITKNTNVPDEDPEKGDQEPPKPGLQFEWHLDFLKSKMLGRLTRRSKLSRLQTVIGFVFVVAGVGLSLMAPLLVRQLIDRFAKGISAVMVGATIGTMIASGLLLSVGNYYYSLAGLTLTRNTQDDVYAKILHKPVSFFDQHQSGGLAGQLVNNLTLVKDYYAQGYPNLVSVVLTILATAGILFYLNWQLTAAVLISLPIFAILVGWIGPKLIAPVETYQDELSRYSAKVTQSFSNIRMIKGNVAENVLIDDTKQDTRKLNQLGKKMSKVMAYVTPLMSTLMYAIIALIFAIGSYMVAKGKMTNGTLVSFILFSVQLASPLSNFSSFVQTKKSAEGAAKQLLKQLDEKGDEDQQPASPAAFDAQAPLIFDHVSMKYDGQHGLADISLTLTPKHLYALVGPSGAGKSTLISLIERFYEPDAGSLKLGPTAVSDFAVTAWRRHIAYVPQLTEIMSGTFKSFLLLGAPKAADADLLAALAKVQLKDFVLSLPAGLDAPLSEFGGNMSGGQRQRLTIAQALLRKADIYLFDEITANLDADSEAVIRDIMQALAGEHLVVSAAHRLSSVRAADFVIVLEDGRLSGFGAPEVLKQTNATFARYLKEQAL